jgi:DNA (cytosine-5)-methyltransferase 1
MQRPVLSTFPGWDLLGRAFHEAGFCVVHSPEWLWGQDVRNWHSVAGVFQGVIGGPPCQAFSRLAHMVRQNGYEPKFGNLIPDFERIVEESECDWFVMEEVPDAPVPHPVGYGVHDFLLNNRDLGDDVNRLRRISFGCRGERRVLNVDVVALHSQRFEYAATGGSARPVAIGGSGKPKKFRDGKGRMPFNTKSQSAFRELCRKQGLPDGFDLPGFTVESKCKAVGNGVPMRMGHALARGVIETLGLEV